MFINARGLRFYGLGLLCVLAASTAAAEKWSLHVGVNKYKHMPGGNLNGCVNDARAMREQLVNRFGFPESNAMLIADEQATAANIVKMFEDHLIAKSKPGDSLVFSYSGHGMQVPDSDGDESDNMDEILCPHDIAKNRDGEIVNVVTDDMLRDLCARIADRHVLVILDCCHSGTGTRALFAEGKSRFLSIDDFEPTDVETVTLYEAPTMEESAKVSSADDPFVSTRSASTRSLGATAGSLSFLSACKSNEVAKETTFLVAENPRQHGAFTAKLVNGLIEMDNGPGGVTYQGLEQWLNGPLTTAEYAQHPQVEVPDEIRSRVLFEFEGEAPAANPTPDPSPTTVASTPSSEPFSGVQNVKVFLTHASVFDSESPTEEPELRTFLREHLDTMKTVELVGTRDNSNATVFYGTHRDRYNVGVLLPSGDIAKRFTLPRLETSELGKLDTELNRIYLVNGMTNLRNPGRDHLVSATMLNDETDLGDGDPVEIAIRTAVGGYLTLINIDSAGGWSSYDPVDLGLPRVVNAGQTLFVPSRDSGLEYFVQEPFGEELFKVLITQQPLELPASITPQDAAAMFATRALGVRSREEKQGLDWLAADNFASATVRFRTYPK